MSFSMVMSCYANVPSWSIKYLINIRWDWAFLIFKASRGSTNKVRLHLESSTMASTMCAPKLWSTFLIYFIMLNFICYFFGLVIINSSFIVIITIFVYLTNTKCCIVMLLFFYVFMLIHCHIVTLFFFYCFIVTLLW